MSHVRPTCVSSPGWEVLPPSHVHRPPVERGPPVPLSRTCSTRPPAHSPVHPLALGPFGRSATRPSDCSLAGLFSRSIVRRVACRPVRPFGRPPACCSVCLPSARPLACRLARRPVLPLARSHVRPSGYQPVRPLSRSPVRRLACRSVPRSIRSHVRPFGCQPVRSFARPPARPLVRPPVRQRPRTCHLIASSTCVLAVRDRTVTPVVCSPKLHMSNRSGPS